MIAKIKTKADFIFVRAGNLKKGDGFYILLSNGMSEFYPAVSKKSTLTLDDFSDLDVGEEIALEVETIIGSDSVTLLGLAKPKAA